MFEIDFRRKYTIMSNLDDVNVIIDLLDPSSYSRLFVDSHVNVNIFLYKNWKIIMYNN